METSKIIISRSDTNLVKVTKGELIILLDQLNNTDGNINISSNFLKEILNRAIGSFSEEKEIRDYEY